MATLESAVWADLQSVIAGSWPEVTGVYRWDLLVGLPIRAAMNASELLFPLALVRFDESIPEDWGLDNEAYRMQCTIGYLLRKDDPRTSATGGFDVQTLLFNQLTALRTVLNTHVSAFQTAGEYPILRVGDQVELPFLLRKENLPVAYGELQMKALVGQSFGS